MKNYVTKEEFNKLTIKKDPSKIILTLNKNTIFYIKLNMILIFILNIITKSYHMFIII